jgi:glycerone phosphate O-acyltransferase/fatty acyl-CoA reductase
VRVADEGENIVSFECSLVWPLVESYWVTVVYLYSIARTNSLLELKKLIPQIQVVIDSD